MIEILFSIPIYAFSEDILHTNYQKYLNRSIQHVNNGDTELQKRIHFNLNHKKQLIYKNYIIGFLDVVYDKGDITFDRYLMTTDKSMYTNKERKKMFLQLESESLPIEDRDLLWYNWQATKKVLYRMNYGTNKKHYMENEKISGFHIYNLSKKSNSEILLELEEDINSIVNDTKQIYGNTLYFDFSNFNFIKKYIDFNHLFNDN